MAELSQKTSKTSRDLEPKLSRVKQVFCQNVHTKCLLLGIDDGLILKDYEVAKKIWASLQKTAKIKVNRGTEQIVNWKREGF